MNIINIGDIKRNNRSQKFIWVMCPDCLRERWIQERKDMSNYVRCSSCAAKLAFRLGARRPKIGNECYNWKGGKHKDKQGYIHIRLPSSDFFFAMAKPNGYVLEHRLIMAKKLGRCLQPWENVHHKGIRYVDIRNKSDNLEDNLELTTNGSHIREHSKGYRDGFKKGYLDGKDKRIKKLEAQLQKQIT